MEKKKVIERFCALASKVGEEQFHSTLPTDCFCGEEIAGFQFSEKVLDFIEEAVEAKLNAAGSKV